MLDEVRCGAARDAARTEKDVNIGVRYLLLLREETIHNNQEAQEKLERLFYTRPTIVHSVSPEGGIMCTLDLCQSTPRTDISAQLVEKKLWPAVFKLS